MDVMAAVGSAMVALFVYALGLCWACVGFVRFAVGFGAGVQLQIQV